MMLIGCIHAASERWGVNKADVINHFQGKNSYVCQVGGVLVSKCNPSWHRFTCMSVCKIIGTCYLWTKVYITVFSPQCSLYHHSFTERTVKYIIFLFPRWPVIWSISDKATLNDTKTKLIVIGLFMPYFLISGVL